LIAEAADAHRFFTYLGDELGLAKVWHRRGFVGIVLCRWRSAQEAFQRARRHARRAGADRDEAVASSMLFFCLVLGPTHVDSAIRRGEKIVAEERFRGVAGFGLAALGSLHAMRGDFDESRALVEQSRVILEDLGQTRRLVEASLFAATVSLLEGRADAAAERLRWAHDVAIEAGQRGLAASIGVHLAEALYALDRHAEADTTAVASGADAAGDDVFTQIKWRALHGKALARYGDMEAALEVARQAVSLSEATDDLNSRAAALADLAFVLRAAGLIEEEGRRRDEAIALYREKGNVVGEQSLREGEGRDE